MRLLPNSRDSRFKNMKPLQSLRFECRSTAIVSHNAQIILKYFQALEKRIERNAPKMGFCEDFGLELNKVEFVLIERYAKVSRKSFISHNKTAKDILYSLIHGYMI